MVIGYRMARPNTPEEGTETSAPNLRVPLVQREAESRAEGQPDPDSEPDIVDRYPHAGAESEADGNTRRHPATRRV